MPRRRRIRDPEPAGMVLGKVVPGRLAQVAAAWPRAAGARLSGTSAPVALAGGTLTVAVQGTRAAHLGAIEAELVARLNEAMGAPLVERLRFVQRELTSPSPVFEERPLTAEMTEAVGAIDDPQLRASLERAMRRRRG